MDDAAVSIEHHEAREAETVGTAQAFDNLLGGGAERGTATRIVDVDVFVVPFYDIPYGAVVLDELGKAEAPHAPVATQLADDMLSLRLGTHQGTVDLLHGVDTLIVEALLGMKSKDTYKEKDEKENATEGVFHRVNDFEVGLFIPVNLSI